MVRPFFSIIIATYNSETTLKYTLDSIRSQKLDQELLEILVVDGGSTDRTIEIAKSYNVILLENTHKLPEYAKAIGIRNATGQYVIRMDSDEEFSYQTQLLDKMNFLTKYPDVKVLITNGLVSGRKNICGISADYSNVLGDPFSYFVYRTQKDKYNTYKKNVIKENGKFVVMQFDDSDILPLADSAASAMSLDFIRSKYPNDYDTIEFTCRAYDTIIHDTKLCGVILGDTIRHNCSSSFKVYISKLKFRVINNLFHKEESGFSSKEFVNVKLRRRKYLFCLYSLLLPIPILDSVRLAICYKTPSFLMHFIYLYYVCIQIAFLGIVKVFGGERVNKSYGK